MIPKGDLPRPWSAGCGTPSIDHRGSRSGRGRKKRWEKVGEAMVGVSAGARGEAGKCVNPGPARTRCRESPDLAVVATPGFKASLCSRKIKWSGTMRRHLYKNDLRMQHITRHETCITGPLTRENYKLHRHAAAVELTATKKAERPGVQSADGSGRWMWCERSGVLRHNIQRRQSPSPA